ncbi:hypothetical protein ACIBKZ_27100 [Streptomyces sp. NPDC050421]
MWCRPPSSAKSYAPNALVGYAYAPNALVGYAYAPNIFVGYL